LIFLLVKLFFFSRNFLRANFCSWNLLVLIIDLETCCVLIFFFVKLLVKLILSREIIAWWLFVRRTSCALIFCSWNLLHVNFFYFSLDFYIDFSHRETDFVHGNCCMLIFVRGTFFVPIFVREAYCMLIFLFLKLMYWFLSSWNGFCSWNLLHANFVLQFYLILIFFIVKLIVYWFVLSWNFFIIIICVVNLLHFGFFFVKHDTYWFLFVKLVVCRLFLLEASLYIDFCFRETSYIFVSFSWILLRVGFILLKLLRLFIKCYKIRLT